MVGYCNVDPIPIELSLDSTWYTGAHKDRLETACRAGLEIGDVKGAA